MPRKQKPKDDIPKPVPRSKLKSCHPKARTRKPTPIKFMPWKFTVEKGDEICANLRLGMPYPFAARAAGITEETLCEWLARGRQGDCQELTDFSIKADQSAALFVKDNLELMRNAAKEPRNWAAAMTMMERFTPGQPFAVINRQQVQVEEVDSKEAAIENARIAAIEAKKQQLALGNQAPETIIDVSLEETKEES